MVNRPNIVLGTAHLADPETFWGESDEHVLEAFSILKKHGHSKLDSAIAYAGSEDKLGSLEAGIAHGLTIDTKWRGGWAIDEDDNSATGMLAVAEQSLQRLRVPQIDIFYIHAPSYKTPLEETLAGVDAAHQAGIFKRFGLSNYPPKDVQRVYDICKENNYVLPSVYQGNYSAITRKIEEDLFPVLRKLGMAFYAYSPIAGGFLAKSAAQIRAGGTRFSPDQMHGLYHMMYVKDELMEALDDWEGIAEREGASRAELAYRWIVYHSELRGKYGDGVVVGASRPSQLEETLSFCDKGPLTNAAVEGIQAIWDKVKDYAPVDNYQAVRG
ncbi:hypothetical protein Neosp_012222 [[Neocosmospora] mangrovei]